MYNRVCEKGFTLLEILVALAILSGVIFTVILSLNYHLDVVERDRSQTIATMLAREKLEEMRMTGMPDKTEGDFAPAHAGFRWKYDIEALPVKDIQRIYMTVEWGRKEKVTIETYRKID